MRSSALAAIAAVATAAALASACAAPPPAATHAFRLRPGADLRLGIEREVERLGWEAGWVACCVGSLTDYSLRFANRSDGNQGTGHFEILALTGTVSVHGSHLHLAIGDGDGRTLGGHLLAGCRVYTTAEIVLGRVDACVFRRAVDGTTPWPELQVEAR